MRPWDVFPKKSNISKRETVKCRCLLLITLRERFRCGVVIN